MTAVQLLNRLIRKSTVKSITEARADQLEDIVDSVNSAIYEFYQTAPERFRRTTVSADLHAPRTVAITTTAGSNTLTGTPFDLSDRGKALLIPGDTRYNEVTGTNTLLHDAKATGTLNATLYCNAARVGDDWFERIVTSPRVVETGKKLIHDEKVKSRYHDWRSGHYNLLDISIDGDPTYYWVENSGIADAALDTFQLRLFPFPGRAINIVFDANLFPARLDISNLKDTILLPVPLPYVQTIILPIAVYHLMGTNTGDTENERRATTDYQRALVLASSIPIESAPPNRRLTRSR